MNHESNEEIIYIEADEEITSVVDRLHKSSGKKVVLVVPRGAVVIQSLVNLKLLEREATNVKKTIGVVTPDAIARNMIAQAGIAILDSVKNKRVLVEPKGKTVDQLPDEVDLTVKAKPTVPVHHFQDNGDKATFSHHDVSVAPRVSEHEPLPRVTAAPGSKKRSSKAFFVALAVAIAFIIIGAIAVPSAKVTLFVSGEPYERDLDLQVLTDQKVPSVEQSLVPGDFAEGETQVSDNFNSSGTKNVGEKAKGTVTISNDAGIDQILASGSKLSSSGLLFLTTSELTIAKATLNNAGDKVPGKAIANIEAVEAGDKHNVSGLSVSVSKDKLSGKIESTSGGSTREITVVSAQDIAAAKAALENKAQDQLKIDLAKKSGKVVMDGAIKFEVLESTPSVSEGTESANFEMKIKEKAKAIVFQEAIFRETYIEILRRSLPPENDLVFSSSDEIVTQVADADFTSGKMTIKGVIKTQIVPKFNVAVIKKDLVFKSSQEAQALISELDHVKSGNIIVSPAWFKRLPLVAARIDVSIEHE